MWSDNGAVRRRRTANNITVLKQFRECNVLHRNKEFHNQRYTDANSGVLQKCLMYFGMNVLLHSHRRSTCRYVCHLCGGAVRNAAASFGVHRAGSFAHRRASSYPILADILLLPSYHLASKVLKGFVQPTSCPLDDFFEAARSLENVTATVQRWCLVRAHFTVYFNSAARTQVGT